MIYLFPDTNIFLQFKPVNQIKWSDFINSEFRIAIAPIVLRELDNHKYDQRQRVSKRAKAIISQLRPALRHAGESLYALCSEDAFPADFESYLLNPSSQDDRLLISMIKFRGSHSKDQCVLVSDDTALLIKADNFGFRTIELSESDRLPPEPDERDQELRHTKLELQKLQNRMPKLQFTLKNGDFFDRVLLDPLPTEGERATKLTEKLEHFVEEKDAFKNPALLIPGYWEQKYGRYNIEKFNKAVDTYNSALEKYTKELWNLKDWTARSFPFNGILINQGTEPADNIEVLLKFPEDLEVSRGNERPHYSMPPKKPRLQDFTTMDILFPVVPVGTTELSNILETENEPFVGGEDEIEVLYHIAQLKHTKSTLIEDIWVTFSSHEVIRNLTVNFEVHADNVIEPLKGQFNLTFAVSGMPDIA